MNPIPHKHRHAFYLGALLASIFSAGFLIAAFRISESGSISIFLAAIALLPLAWSLTRFRYFQWFKHKAANLIRLLQGVGVIVMFLAVVLILQETTVPALPLVLLVGFALIGLLLVEGVNHLSKRFDEVQMELKQHRSLFALYSSRHPLPIEINSWAFSPDSYALILEEIARTKPRVIVELGSGTSTLITASWLKEGETRIISFEHLSDYTELVNERLSLHGVDHVARVHAAPLKPLSLEGETFNWYDADVIRAALGERKIDLLVVDGPVGAAQWMARFPALPILYPHLSPGAVIIADDTGREDERVMVEKWAETYNDLEPTFFNTEFGMAIIRRRG